MCDELVLRYVQSLFLEALLPHRAVADDLASTKPLLVVPSLSSSVAGFLTNLLHFRELRLANRQVRLSISARREKQQTGQRWTQDENNFKNHTSLCQVCVCLLCVFVCFSNLYQSVLRVYMYCVYMHCVYMYCVYMDCVL